MRTFSRTELGYEKDFVKELLEHPEVSHRIDAPRRTGRSSCLAYACAREAMREREQCEYLFLTAKMDSAKNACRTVDDFSADWKHANVKIRFVPLTQFLYPKKGDVNWSYKRIYIDDLKCVSSEWKERILEECNQTPKFRVVD